MNVHKGLLIALAIIIFLATIFMAAAGIPPAGAEVRITPTLIVTDRRFLPIVHGYLLGPTPTMTVPPATRTPYVTLTPSITPSLTPTHTESPPDFTPSPTASHTPTATPTKEKPPVTRERLIGPWLFYSPSSQAIFTCLRWNLCSPDSFIEFYSDGTLYHYIHYDPGDGSPHTHLSKTGKWSINQGLVITDYDDGKYLEHDIRQDGDWDHLVSKTLVNGRVTYMRRGVPPTTPTPTPTASGYWCEFETLADGPAAPSSDLEILKDGRLLITNNASNDLAIFDPRTKKFKSINLPDGSNNPSVVLKDGTVLLGQYNYEVGGEISMLFDPVSEKITRLNNYAGCAETYRITSAGLAVIFCNQDEVLFYNPDYDEPLNATKLAHWYFNNSTRKSFALPGSSPGTTLITNGLFGEEVHPIIKPEHIFDLSGNFSPPPAAANAISYDMQRVYFSGGSEEDNLGVPSVVKEVYVVNLDLYYVEAHRLADMLVERTYHEMIGLSDENIMVISGVEFLTGKIIHTPTIEIYVPNMDKWFNAGELNTAREGHQAIQLVNGEIFVIGGFSYLNGTRYTAPPEIGRCERRE